MGKGVEGFGALCHYLAVPTTRKVVRSGGSVGSSPNSSSMSNLTSFFIHCLGRHSSIGSCGGGPSSVGVGASSCHALLLDSCGLGCMWRSLREQLSQSSAGCDQGGLGEGNWCLLGHWGEGLWFHFDLSLHGELEHHLLNADHPAEESSLGSLAKSTPRPS